MSFSLLMQYAGESPNLVYWWFCNRLQNQLPHFSDAGKYAIYTVPLSFLAGAVCMTECITSAEVGRILSISASSAASG